MPNYTTNLNLEKPLQSEQYNVDVFNANADKIDAFAGQVPARALTADELTTGAKINGVNFKGDTNVITGLGLHSSTEVYAQNNLAYKVIDDNVVVKRSLVNNNTGDNFDDSDYWEDVALGGGSGYQLFDIVMKDHVLSYEETLGLAPLGTYVYKEAIAGTRYGYPDFYQMCVDEYNDGTTVNEYISSNIVVTGSLTDNNGVISGFSTSNYATVENFIGTTADTIEFVIKLNTGSTLSANTFLYAGFSIQFYNGKLNLTGTGNIGTYTYSANTDYYIKVTYSNNTLECAYSTDGMSYTVDGTISYTGAIQNLIYLGYGNVNNALSGSIDLNECYININGTRWWNGINLFTYTENSNKHRFYNIADKATFDNMYAITGEAWYYGIDTTNERIFLPRSTRFKNGTTSDVGGYQAAGLPNITGSLGLVAVWQGSSEEGALSKQWGGSPLNGSSSGSCQATKIDLNASNSNPIYGASNTVEYSSTKLIPYIVVGNVANISAATDVVDVTTTENDTLPLFTGIYFDYAPNNVSWVMAGGQVVSGTIYTFAYNELVSELTTPKYNLNVIDVDDMVVGTDYSTYWKVDQTNQTFTCPTKLSYGAFTGGIKGNGITLGFQEREDLFGGLEAMGSSNSGALRANISGYGMSIGESTTGNTYLTSKTLGITTDDTKSGIVATVSTTAKLYFKVANAVQNLELLDAGEVLEAVNDLIPNNSSVIAGYAMPSDTYEDLTLGASGSTYTAPANGWVYFNKACTAGGQHITLNASIAYRAFSTASGQSLLISCPVKKGTNFEVLYSAGGSLNVFRFIYAQGSESEAN